MQSSLPVRHLRRLSTTTATISHAKSQLRAEHDPDKALKIYSSVSKDYSSPLTSRYAQELTVRRLAKSRRFSDIETLLESHKSDPQIKQEAFLSSILRSYGCAGMFNHALNTYHQMDSLGTPRSSVSFNALLSACTQSRVFGEVPILFADLPKKYGFSPDKVSYGILIKSYCEMGMVEKAIETLNEMEEKEVEVTTVTFTTILSCLYKKGKVEEAEKIWSEMVKNGCNVDVAAYNVKIGYAQDGEPENVKGLIEEMKHLGLMPDTISYNYLMTCYFKNGMIEQAKKVYNAMIVENEKGDKGLEKIGCRPNATTFRTLIYYLCRNGEFETGYEVFQKSVKAHKIPDFRTLKYLVEGLVKETKVKEAKELIHTIRLNFPPNLLNVWTKIEKNLGLDSTYDDTHNNEEVRQQATA